MWFLFGIIPAIVFTVLLIKIRFLDTCDGTVEVRDGIAYEYHEHRYYGTASVHICVDTASDLTFKLKVENWYDKICKLIGVSQEIQSGNQEFDRAIYVVADDVRLERLLHSQFEISRQIYELFMFANSKQVRKTEVYCHSGRLWVECYIC